LEKYATAKEGFLRSFLDLSNGIPSDDTFNRVFFSIKSEQFESCFIDWVSSLVNLTGGEIIPIDGKTIRGGQNLMEKSLHFIW